MTIETKDNDDSLFPRPRRNRAGFTREEIQDIQRFADAHDLDSAARNRLIAHIKDVRAAYTIQRRKGESQVSKS
jgi:hypothetical protein